MSVSAPHLFLSQTMQDLTHGGSTTETIELLSKLRCIKQIGLFTDLDELCIGFEREFHENLFEAQANLLNEIRERIVACLDAFITLKVLKPLTDETSQSLAVEPLGVTAEMTIFSRRKKTITDINVLLGRLDEMVHTFSGWRDTLARSSVKSDTSGLGSQALSLTSVA